PWVGLDVGDYGRLAAPACLDEGVAEARDGTSIGGRDRARIGPLDDELVALDVCVVDTTRLEMLTDQPDRDSLDLDRISQGTQPLVQRDQKLPFGRHRVDVGILVLLTVHLGGAPTVGARRARRSGRISSTSCAIFCATDGPPGPAVLPTPRFSY